MVPSRCEMSGTFSILRRVYEPLFVFSTGRCGTQWLADLLARAYGDRALVAHEPIDSDYASREMLGVAAPHELDPELAEPILEHVASIEETLATRAYIECGHPLWSSLPYLLTRFPRARVVHLVRHPVPTALSWITQSVYTPPLAPHWPEKILLSPFDAGVRFVEYRERWNSLTPYEKALYYWLEVNALGLRLQKSAGVPWLRLRFEDLVRGEGLESLLAFAGAESALVERDEGESEVDAFHFVTTFWSDPRLIERHPEVLAVARALGYDPLAFDEARLRERYAVG